MSRDRDRDGRARNARRRDALGRPLPRQGHEEPAADEPPAADPAEALAQAQQLLDTGHAFAAHEVLEAVWKSDRTPAEDKQLWRGLAQLAVGLTHEQRGNRTGAVRLIERGAQNLAGFSGTTPHGVDVDGVRAWALAAAADPGRAAPPRLTRCDVGQAAEERS